LNQRTLCYSAGRVVTGHFRHYRRLVVVAMRRHTAGWFRPYLIIAGWGVKLQPDFGYFRRLDLVTVNANTGDQLRPTTARVRGRKPPLPIVRHQTAIALKRIRPRAPKTMRYSAIRSRSARFRLNRSPGLRSASPSDNITYVNEI